MIGILCGRDKKKLFIDSVQKSAVLKTATVVVFSTPDVNLNEKKVFGTVINDGGAKNAMTELPNHIYNFSVQKTKARIKELKLMSECENVTIYNPVNSFDQWSIMKMLASDALSRQHLLPFAAITKEEDISLENSAGFILRPRNGCGHTKTTYFAKTKTGYDTYSVGGKNAFSHFRDIQSAVNQMTENGKWLIMFAPELITNKNRLLTVRGYLYKTKDGSWELALKTVLSQTEEVYGKTDGKTNEALKRMIEYINNFIPDLAFCTIDFTLDKDGNPYFLSLGGWQGLMQKKAPHKTLVDALCSSLASRHCE